MSENLVYGAEMQKYGAVADGKADCSDAVMAALNNNESLLSFGFGTYLFTKPIVLNSNTKLHFHPNANIIFAPESENINSFIYAENSAAIEIAGGLFNIKDGVKCNVFSFSDCKNIRISGCSVNAPAGIGSVVFDKCEYACVSNVIFNGASDALVLMGECSNITFKNSTVKSAVNVIQGGKQNKPCEISGLDIKNISVLFCDSFIEFLSGNGEDINIEDINARFSFAFFKLFDSFSLGDTTIENISVYIVDRGANQGKNLAYFSLATACDYLEIRNFKRQTELESTPLVPTLLFKNTNTNRSKIIIDGITLDNVIAARGKSKTVDMTTAKLTNPHNKFIYTLEINVSKGDVLNIPQGDFDYLTLYEA